MRLEDELPNAAAVLILSREQLAAIMLEYRNAEADKESNADLYHWAERDFQRHVFETYRDNDVLDRFAEAFRYMQGRGYVANEVNQLFEGWFRLTGTGRRMKRRDLVPQVRVPRDVNSGPAPDFMRVLGRGDLAKHLTVVCGKKRSCASSHERGLRLSSCSGVFLRAHCSAER